MEMKIVGVTLAAFVSLVVLAAVLVPVLNDATTTTDTLTNDGFYRMQKITADDTTEYTLKWVKATDTFTLNGVEVDIGDHSLYTDELGVSVAMTDVSVCRYVTNLRVQSWISGQGGSLGYSGSTCTINFNNGTQTITMDEGLESEVSRTTTYEFAYFISNTGDYSMKAKTVPAYVKADSEMYAVGVTYLGTSTPGTPVLSVLKMTGDASSVEFSAIYGLSGTATFADVTIDKTADPDYLELYDLNKVTATVTYDSTDTAITYSYFIVPHEVTAERAQHLSSGQIELLDVIPILVIVAILLAVIALVIRSKLE